MIVEENFANIEEHFTCMEDPSKNHAFLALVGQLT